MKRKSQQHTMGVPMILFRGSLSGLCLRCALLLDFAPLFCCRGLLVLLVLFASLCVLCSRAVLSMELLSCALVTRTEIAVDQGEKAHVGVFKSSPSRISDELTGTCRSQECSWQLDAGKSDIVSMGRRLHGLRATWQILPTHEQCLHAHTDLPRVVQGKSHRAQHPIGRFATQTRHSGSDPALWRE